VIEVFKRPERLISVLARLHQNYTSVLRGRSPVGLTGPRYPDPAASMGPSIAAQMAARLLIPRQGTVQ